MVYAGLYVALARNFNTLSRLQKMSRTFFIQASCGKVHLLLVLL
jgi:hypothetical protein